MTSFEYSNLRQSRIESDVHSRKFTKALPYVAIDTSVG